MNDKTEQEMAEVVAVFDFDRTLIPVDSDEWVINEMGLHGMFQSLFTSMDWNSLMDKIMTEAHAQGKTAADIEDCLKRTPIHKQTISAIKSAHALGCDLKIISDANTFFIEKILESHEILSCFSQIFTNPTVVEEDGKLRIFPYQKGPHGCSLCPANMCKGSIIEGFRCSSKPMENKTYIYVGDGTGDFCPCIRLKGSDFVMARKKYPLSKCIQSNKHLVRAQVHEWNEPADMSETLASLIREVLEK